MIRSRKKEAAVLAAALLVVTGCSSKEEPFVYTNQPGPSASAESAPSADDTPTIVSPSPELDAGFQYLGNSDFKTGDGYTFRLNVSFSSSLASTDVGSEPPGKTDVILEDATFNGTITNTTEGGRELPAGRVDEGFLYGTYPVSSYACKLDSYEGNQEPVLHPDNSTGMLSDDTAVKKTWCAVQLFKLIDASGFTKIGVQSLPNGEPIDVTGESYAETPPSLAIMGVDEKDAAKWVKAVNKPVALGVSMGRDLPETGPECKYLALPGDSDTKRSIFLGNQAMPASAVSKLGCTSK